MSKWIFTGKTIFGFKVYKCSECGDESIDKTKQCENCKAEMFNGEFEVNDEEER